MARRNVFVSHSHRDGILARLIGHILHEEDVSCFFSERDIRTGENFDSRIIHEIHKSDLMLVIWNRDARESAWVNQEIGIALGHRIPVWPLAIDDIAIEGAIFNRQGLKLSAHVDLRDQLRNLARQIASATSFDENFEPYIDRYLLGKENRTRWLVKFLQRENQSPKPDYVIRMQAAFSCFAVSDDPGYGVAGYHTAAYHRLLVDEADEFRRMMSWAELRATLWPQRPYDDRFIRMRFMNLIHFLEEDANNNRARFVIGKHGPDHLIILDKTALIAGEKDFDVTEPGYNYTSVSIHGPTINRAIDIFDGRFNELWNEHAREASVLPTDFAAIRQFVIHELRTLAPV